MEKTFRIGIISDPHIASINEMPYGTNVRDNFLKALKDMLEASPDHIVITGDLCYREPDRNIYIWIKETLDQTSVPYSVIAGNHDNSALIAEVFNLKDNLINGELYYSKDLGNYQTIFLDTAKAAMSEEQILWFKAQLTAVCTNPVIFMHHPPCKSMVEFMDKNYPFLMEEEFIKVLKLCCKNPTIFCGHYHVTKTVIKDNITIFLTGSTFYAIDENSRNFRKDNKAPGWRLIDLGYDAIYTSYRYIDQS